MNTMPCVFGSLYLFGCTLFRVVCSVGSAPPRCLRSRPLSNHSFNFKPLFLSQSFSCRKPESRLHCARIAAVTMMGVLVLLVILPYFFQPAQSAYNCTACEERKCPPILTPCPMREAIDPCGCCRHCAKQEREICGGPDWEYGYCGNGYKCAAVNGTGLVEIPKMGICKDMPGYNSPLHYAEDDDENCPEHSGCYKVMGTCDCVTKRTCIPDFSMSRYDPLYCEPQYDDPSAEHLFHFPCYRHGCDIVDNQCVCQSSGCDRTFQFKDGRSCYKVIRDGLCANVTCPEVEPLKCPQDSVSTKPHTPYGLCCPTIPSDCTCNFNLCNNKCPKGKRKVMVRESDGVPGRCCDKFLCVL